VLGKFEHEFLQIFAVYLWMNKPADYLSIVKLNTWK